jgi:hypothetical protein
MLECSKGGGFKKHKLMLKGDNDDEDLEPARKRLKATLVKKKNRGK